MTTPITCAASPVELTSTSAKSGPLRPDSSLRVSGPEFVRHLEAI